jgi:hypothetical protein
MPQMAQATQRSARQRGLATARALARALTVTRAGAALVEALAVAGLISALAGWHWALTASLTAVALGCTVVFGVRLVVTLKTLIRPTGTFVVTRILCVLTVGFLQQSAAPATVGTDSVLHWLAALLLSMVLLGEMLVTALAGAAAPYGVNLAGLSVRNTPLLPAPRIFFINVVALLVYAALSALDAPGWLELLVSIVAALLTFVFLADCAVRIRARWRWDRVLPELLAAHAPTFLVHWDAPRGSIHQLGMWLPYLERLEQPFVVVLRNANTLPEVEQLTRAPILVRRRVKDLDAMLTPSLKAVFYVNTAPKNLHMLRYLEVRQIQLNHGDSDKAPSYRRLFKMYDRNFVAGQAAIDRFTNHGVEVPREAFEIVGRPQVESIEVQQRPIRELTSPRVLYAPTWFGYLNDSRYSSLPIGLTIVRALVTRGCQVIFRPHPWARNTASLAREADRIAEFLKADASASGRDHLWGEKAENQLSILDCFNVADAMVSDVSSVVADFMYSEKPFAICAMDTGSPEEFLADFPLGRASYVVAADLNNLDAVLADMLHTDPLGPVRREFKSYYLGDFPADRYAEGFLDVARRYL